MSTEIEGTVGAAAAAAAPQGMRKNGVWVRFSSWEGVCVGLGWVARQMIARNKEERRQDANISMNRQAMA